MSKLFRIVAYFGLAFIASTLQAAAPITLEAEQLQVVSGKWETRGDTLASGKKSLYASKANTGELAGVFRVDTAGSYTLAARVRVRDLDSNAFAFSLDSAPAQVWTLPKCGYQSFTWSTHFQLAAGEHVLHVYGRKKGTLLDEFVLTRDGDTPTPPDDDPGGDNNDDGGDVEPPPVDPPPVNTGNVIRVGGTHNSQALVQAKDGCLVDLAGGEFLGQQNALSLNPWPDAVEFGHKSETQYPKASNLYPLSIKGGASNFFVRGGVSRGLLDPLAPWHVWKGIADGDAVRVEGLGTIDVGFVRVDNAEDGFSPQTPHDQVTEPALFKLHDCYFSRVHDDCVENDSAHNLLIENCLLEGHTFYSCRGDANPNCQVTVKNCVIGLVLQPHWGRISGATLQLRVNTRGGYPYPDGLGNGGIWKLNDAGKSGKLHCEDCVILVSRPSTSSNDATGFMPRDVTYKNVTVVWLGSGEFPDTAPAGVTITRDKNVYDRAKAAWFAAHAMFVEGQAINHTQPVQ